MNFTIDKQDFFKSIAITESIISTREIRSVISSIHIQAENNTVTLTSTDLEISIKTRLKASVTKPGSIVLPAKKLSQSIREFRSDSIQFDSDDECKVQLIDPSKVNRAHISLMGTPSEEYPPLPTMPDSEFINLPAPLFSEMLRKTVYSIANEDQRYVFNGLFIKNIDKKVDFVATDGRRLALVQRELPDRLPFDDGIIVPNKAIREIQKLVDASQGCSVAYNKNDKQVHFRIGEVDFITKLLDGQYPDYNMVIPKSLEYTVEIHKDNLESSLRQVAVMAAEPSKQVRVSIQADELLVSASTPDVGEADDRLSIEFKGEETITSFNSTYMLEILKVIQSDHVALDFSNPGSPAIMRDLDDPQFTAVIMPMQV